MNQTCSISLAPCVRRAPGGHLPPASGFRPRFFPSLQTTCECQRRIGPAGVGPTSPSRVLHIAPTRTAGVRARSRRSAPSAGRSRRWTARAAPAWRSAWKKNDGAVAGLSAVGSACRIPLARRRAGFASSPLGRRDEPAEDRRARVALRAASRARPPGTGADGGSGRDGQWAEASECCPAAACRRGPEAWRPCASPDRAHEARSPRAPSARHDGCSRSSMVTIRAHRFSSMRDDDAVDVDEAREVEGARGEDLARLSRLVVGHLRRHSRAEEVRDLGQHLDAARRGAGDPVDLDAAAAQPRSRRAGRCRRRSTARPGCADDPRPARRLAVGQVLDADQRRLRAAEIAPELVLVDRVACARRLPEEVVRARGT